MTIIERYRLATWPDGTVAAFTDGDRGIAGRDLTILPLVKAEDYDALADQLKGAVQDRERLGRRLDQLEASARVAESAMADVMRQIAAARGALALPSSLAPKEA